MMTFWHELSARDKRMLKLLMVFLMVVFFFNAIWWPLHHWRLRTQQALQSARALQQWMTMVYPEWHPTHSQKSTDILTTVKSALREAHLQADKISLLPGRTVSLHFSQVPFRTLINVLMILAQQGIHTSTANITRVDQAGTVNAELVLVTAEK